MTRRDDPHTGRTSWNAEFPVLERCCDRATIRRQHVYRRNWALDPGPGPITYRDRARSSDAIRIADYALRQDAKSLGK